MVANYQAILSKHWNDESGQCVYVIATTNSKISLSTFSSSDETFTNYYNQVSHYKNEVDQGH